jgi:pilus assembly protein Flp/PilA
LSQPFELSWGTPDSGDKSKKRTAMKKFADSVKKFIVSEDGPTAVEYAVMMALIIVVCIGTVTTIGTNAKAKFEAVKTALS